jgi:hypothetical protein
MVMKNILFIALLLMMAGVAQAQPPRVHKMADMPQPMQDSLRRNSQRFGAMQQAVKDSLHLTAQQAVRYDSINAKYQKQTMELFANSREMEREQRFNAVQNIMAARDAEMQQTLTAEQYATYKSLTDRNAPRNAQTPRQHRGRR